MATTKFLRLPDVMARTGLSRSTIYHKMSLNDDGFPRSISLGPRAVGWLSDEVESWNQSRINASRPSTDP